MAVGALRRLFCGCLLAATLGIGMWALFQGTPQLTDAEAETETNVRVLGRFGKLQLHFIENQGQADERVAYYLHGRDTSIYFTTESVVFALSEAAEKRSPLAQVSLRDPEPRQRWSVKLEFLGANPEVKPDGMERTEAIVSYFRGPQDTWHTGLKTYAACVNS